MSDVPGNSRPLEQLSTPEVAPEKRTNKYIHSCIMCCYLGFLLSLAGGLGWLFYYLIVTPHRDPLLSRRESLAYFNRFQSEDILKNTIDDKANINKTSIFFIESSRKGVLDSRQACAVESAAKANPDCVVTVLFAGPMNVTFRESHIYITLSAVTNIRFSRLNISDLLKDTVFEDSDYEWQRSKYPIVHSSEILRTLWLYKHGGLYLDWDVIVLKSFGTLPKNFVIKSKHRFESSPILAMSTNGVGREFTEFAVIIAHEDFDPKSLNNGRVVITKTLAFICNTSSVNEISNVTCNGLHILDSDLFQPINSSTWESYYRLQNLSESFIAKDSRCYTIHLWSAYGGQRPILKGSLYANFAQLYCPNIYLSLGDDFGRPTVL